MPKLPRGTGKATTKERAKKPAAKPAAAPKRTAAKKGSGTTAAATATKKKAAPTRSNGGRTKAPERDFRHRPVDRHDIHAPAGPATKLTEQQRVLLGDLFAVVEEHAGEAA